MGAFVKENEEDESKQERKKKSEREGDRESEGDRGGEMAGLFISRSADSFKGWAVLGRSTSD